LTKIGCDLQLCVIVTSDAQSQLKRRQPNDICGNTSRRQTRYGFL
jgi:hypothetical protein